MSRIAARFQALKSEGRGALVTFLTACDPDPETSLAILRGLPAAGADVIEIGVPFTDPVADGPTIQKAANRALAAGASLPKVLEMVAAFRTGDNATPIVLMGYLNPIERYGVERFCADAGKAGVDGLIIVDLPPEESDLVLAPATENGLDIIRLATPTTDAARMQRVVEGASGFIYYVSIAGVTGTRSTSDDDLMAAIPRIRAATDLPVVIGFGIRTPDQAARAAAISDGAVVGSALVETIEQGCNEGRVPADTTRRVLQQVGELAAAIRAH